MGEYPAASRPRRSVIGLPPERPRFEPGSSHVGLVVEKSGPVTGFFSEWAYVCLSPSVAFLLFFILIFT